MPELPAPQTLPALIRAALGEPRDEVVVERVAGRWTPTSSARLLERVENVACSIRAAGLHGGDRVALVAHNCVDWIVCDFATLFAGCVVVPIYPTQALDHTAHILQHSGVRLIFTDSETTAQHLRDAGAGETPIVRFDGDAQDGLTSFEERGATVRAQNAELVASYAATIAPDDLAVLIYTSGTTGAPKGVMLSHDNLGFDAQVSLDCGFEGLEGGVDVISVLPYSHIYEHTLVYIYLLAKVRYFICHDPVDLLNDLRDVRPIGMTSVPRIFDRVLAGIRKNALEAGGLQAKLVPWALAVGRRYMRATVIEHRGAPWLGVQYTIARAVVLRKVRARLGLDRVRFLTSGSAPLHTDTAMTFLALGVPIMQGYGLTETSPVISVSRLSANRYGAVGQPITGVDVKIAPDGEVLVRGRNVMCGYYRDAGATAAALRDGWLHTGDIGELEGGYLRITDRKNEIFKTSTGKWVAPARVEASIKRSPIVAHAMVTGKGQPYPIALICPNWSLLRLSMPGLPAHATHEELARRADVRAFVAHEVYKQTHALATYEQVRQVVIVPAEFSQENGELSPSMKIKRRVVESRYGEEIRRAYAAA